MKKNKKNNFRLIIVTVIGIVLVGLGYISYKNTWKTYQFTDFSIQLPAEFYKTYSSQSTVQFLNYKQPAVGRDFDPQKDKGKLKVEIYRIDGFSLNDYENKRKLQAAEEQVDFVSGKEIVIDGQTGLQYTHSVAVKHPSKNEIISINFQLDFNNYPDLSKKILSTFKFTK